MREYTDQEICQIIQDYDRIIQELRYGVEAFVRELVSLDSNDDWLCSLLALQHSGTGSATTHSSLHDLSDLLKNKKFKGMEYASELQKGINEKLEAIDGIQKIHRCYMCLPRKEHEILQLLYEKSISWNEVAKALQITLQTVKRRRKHALNMIHSMWSYEKADCLAQLDGTLDIYAPSENGAGGIDWSWKKSIGAGESGNAAVQAALNAVGSGYSQSRRDDPGCWVNKGSSGIALPDDTATYGHKLKYVFDVSNVHAVKPNGRYPKAWKLREEHKSDVLHRLEQIYGSTDSTKPFEERIIEISDQLAADAYTELQIDYPDLQDTLL